MYGPDENDYVVKLNQNPNQLGPDAASEQLGRHTNNVSLEDFV